jgi:hypothetical protein
MLDRVFVWMVLVITNEFVLETKSYQDGQIHNIPRK